MTKLIVVLRIFTNALKNCYYIKMCYWIEMSFLLSLDLTRNSVTVAQSMVKDSDLNRTGSVGTCVHAQSNELIPSEIV
jgi:hypothetical protein